MPIDPAKLDRLAQVAVRTGVNLQPGQDLLLTSSTDALPLARKIVEQAYKAGAGLVTTILHDEAMTLARFEHGHDAGFDRAADWMFEAMGKAYEAGTARLAISADNPMLLAEMDPANVARANKAASIARKPAMDPIVGMRTNWNIVAYPTPQWAQTVFPDLDEDAAIDALFDAIFAASRLEGDDPVANWAAHTATLNERLTWLNEQRFSALHYTGPGTDLMLGLADGHIWKGGATTGKNGVTFQANIPTEEVFTCPHAYKVDGTVSSSKPLAHNGSLIDGIQVRFEAGRITQASATQGESVLQQLLQSDDGASRIGEVALVPHSSPISQSGILFYNTLFDENAASHIALGQCYADTIEGGDTLSPEELKQKGGNNSIIHVDWMIGSNHVDIDGIGPDGSRTPVMRQGEWA